MKRKINMKGRSLVSLRDLSEGELGYLIDFAAALKKRKHRGIRGNLLERRSIAMIFEKSSTRTRCAVSVAATDEGGSAEYLGSDQIHLGKKESVPDTARVLGRMFDGILFRGFKQSTAEQLAKHAGVPVWNGLTDAEHPTQALADVMTIKEHFGRLKGLKVVYVGDGRNNVANSLMLACAKTGMHFVNCTPRRLMPKPADVGLAVEIARRNKCTVSLESDSTRAVRGANVIATDVWASMGEEAKLQERIRLLRPYQVNMAMMRRTGNLTSGKVIFLHCLPAFHDSNTETARQTGPMEVTDEVFQAPFSRVFDEAENRVHTLKALMIATIRGS